MNHQLPLISIITICLNAEKTIRRTIESVISQTYGNLEYIIVDGGSTDGTVAIINEYSDRINIIISEKDDGISDAFNKGINCSCGEFIKLLNADDYMPAEHIERSVEAIRQHPEAAFAFGDMIMVDCSGKPIIQVHGDPAYGAGLDYLVPRVNHPTFLVRRAVYDRHGLFEPAWLYAMDYEWLLRIHRAGEHGIYAPDVLLYAQEGGVSSNWREAMREQRAIIVRYSRRPVLSYMVSRFLTLKIGLRVILEQFLPHQIIILFRPGKTIR